METASCLKLQQPLSERTCSHCNRDLPLGAFARRQIVCRSCDAERARRYLRQPENLLKRRRSQAAWYRANKDKVAIQKAESYRQQRARHLAWEARRRAERKGVPYTLEAGDVLLLQRAVDSNLCAVTGHAFGSGPFAPSLDRIDAQHGYVPGNVRVVCRWVNVAMGTWGEAVVFQACADWVSRTYLEATA